MNIFKEYKDLKLHIIVAKIFEWGKLALGGGGDFLGSSPPPPPPHPMKPLVYNNAILVYVQGFVEAMGSLSTWMCMRRLLHRMPLAVAISLTLMVLYYCLATNRSSEQVLFQGKQCSTKSSACITLVNDGQQQNVTEPLGLTHHHALSPLYRSKKYDLYVNSLHKCLDASNLTGYFTQEEFLTQAVANVKYYMDTVRKFIPHIFDSSLPNHCWKAGVELEFSHSLVSGHFNGIDFRVNRTYFDKLFPPLVSLPYYGETEINYPRNHSIPFSCIPEVFISGFYKCGSTYLYYMMTSHPAFVKPQLKEPNWFTRNEHFMAEDEKKTVFFADYIVNFETLVKSLLAESKGRIRYSLDGSVGMMLFWPIFFQQQRIVNFCLLPSVVPNILPKAKFIVVMREPLSMLYSLFWFTCTRFNQPVPSRETQLKGPDIFHKRVIDGISAIKSCLTDFPLVKCLIDSANRPDTFHPLMPKCGEVNFSIYVALYYVHVQKWLSVVPLERFLFLTLEELSESKHQTANQIWSFLKVRPLSPERIKARDDNKQEAVDYKHDPRLAMRNDTREILKSFFHPYNQMLADLLGNEKFLWKQY